MEFDSGMGREEQGLGVNIEIIVSLIILLISLRIPDMAAAV